MNETAASGTATRPKAPQNSTPPATGGVLARLGAGMAAHSRWVFSAWLIVLIVLGALAPSVFSSLAGAGWQANGSESVQVRELAQQYFGGNSSAAVQLVVHSDTQQVNDPGMQDVLAKATALFSHDPRFGQVIAPRPGMSISPDGHTGILVAGANASTDAMVKAVDGLKGPLTALAGNGIEVYPTGSSALWSDFNNANHDAMLKAEMISWPVTLVIMVLAFGSLVAAGLPLLLTLAGLIASAGGLVLLNTVSSISVWAMNFAMMFALALGIDYALFLVSRFRAALSNNRDHRAAVAETMDTAGKAVVLSGLTVLVSLSAVLIVPAPAVRTMAVGIMLAVVFVLAATLTLLPAVLGKLGTKVNAGSMPYAKRQQHRSPRFAAWGELLHKHPWPFAVGALVVLIGLSVPVLSLKVAMPSIQVVAADAPVRQGYELVQQQMGEGAPGMLQIITPSAQAEATAKAAAATPGIAMVTPAQQARDGSGYAMLQALPTVDPSGPAMATILSQLRTELPTQALVGGAPAENLDLQQALNDYLPVIIGIILFLGFLLLLLALQAPLIAVLGTVVSLLSTGAAFGVAKLVFQDGHGARLLLGFVPQGFLDGWGPVFFFAMIFAIAMDYTVFLLSTAKEHYEHSSDPKVAHVDGLAHSGRVIFAAAAVMVAVFLTFALAQPLPPKEMGIILGVAVLLDAVLIRLILLPVLLRLSGHAAWWSPAWLRKVLPNISFTHG